MQRTCKYCLECVYKWITWNGVTWLKNKPQYLMQWLTQMKVSMFLLGLSILQHSVVEMLECWLDPVSWWGKPMTLRSRRECYEEVQPLYHRHSLATNLVEWYSPLFPNILETGINAEFRLILRLFKILKQIVNSNKQHYQQCTDHFKWQVNSILIW